MSKSELKDLCIVIWKLMPEEKREEYYYDTGVLGFIEEVIALAKIDVNKFTEDELDYIADQILYNII